MPETLQFEIRLEAEADVVRACCGGNHEFGECPRDVAWSAPTKADDDDENDGRGVE